LGLVTGIAGKTLQVRMSPAFVSWEWIVDTVVGFAVERLLSGYDQVHVTDQIPGGTGS
jgi:hypothetical protein